VHGDFALSLWDSGRFGFAWTPLLAAILEFVRPYGTQGNSKGMRTQGYVRLGGLGLHPTDKDPSVGTPGLGYSRVLPTGDKTGCALKRSCVEARGS